jgi:hypothetical protein
MERAHLGARLGRTRTAFSVVWTAGREAMCASTRAVMLRARPITSLSKTSTIPLIVQNRQCTVKFGRQYERAAACVARRAAARLGDDADWIAVRGAYGVDRHHNASLLQAVPGMYGVYGVGALETRSSVRKSLCAGREFGLQHPRRRSTYEVAYIFGAICSAKGKGAGLVIPWCDTPAMQSHLRMRSAPR